MTVFELLAFFAGILLASFWWGGIVYQFASLLALAIIFTICCIGVLIVNAPNDR